MADEIVPSPAPAEPPSSTPAPSGPPAASGPPRGVPPYDPKSAYWNASHPDHKAAVDATRVQLAAESRDPMTGAVPAVLREPTYALALPMEPDEARPFTEALHQAGVSGDYAQAIADVIMGSRTDLPATPAGFVPMTSDQGARALQAEWGAEAPQHLARAQRVVDVLKSISPDVKDRIEYALNASGAGNALGLVKAFEQLHDLEPAVARRMVARTFGVQAAERLFGPAPRR